MNVNSEIKHLGIRMLDNVIDTYKLSVCKIHMNNYIYFIKILCQYKMSQYDLLMNDRDIKKRLNKFKDMSGITL